MDEEIKKLREEVEQLKSQIEYLTETMMGNMKRINELKEDFYTIEDNKHRNHNMLAKQLKGTLLKRRFGMDYIKVREFFHFKSDKEAYRLMDKAVKMYPQELMLHKEKGSTKGKRTIVVRGTLK